MNKYRLLLRIGAVLIYGKQNSDGTWHIMLMGERTVEADCHSMRIGVDMVKRAYANAESK